MERGMTVPRIDMVLELAAALGIKCESPLLAGISWILAEPSTASGAFTLSQPEGEPDARSGSAHDG